MAQRRVPRFLLAAAAASLLSAAAGLRVIAQSSLEQVRAGASGVDQSPPDGATSVLPPGDKPEAFREIPSSHERPRPKRRKREKFVRFGENTVRSIPSWREHVLAEALDGVELMCGARKVTLNFEKDGGEAVVDDRHGLRPLFFEHRDKGLVGFSLTSGDVYEYEISLKGTVEYWLADGAGNSNRCSPSANMTADQLEKFMMWQLGRGKFQCSWTNRSVRVVLDFESRVALVDGEVYTPKFFLHQALRGFVLERVWDPGYFFTLSKTGHWYLVPRERGLESPAADCRPARRRS